MNFKIDIRAYKTVICQLYYMVLKHGLGYLKTGSWGEYLGPRGLRLESGEGFTIRSRSPNIFRMLNLED